MVLEELRTTGRPAKEVTASVVRTLTRTDLPLLVEVKGSKAPVLKRLSDRHHALARHLAQGTPPGEAAIICGYDNSRVSILLDDPTFKELMEFYRSDLDRTYRGLHEKLFSLSMDAADLLDEKLQDEEERKKISIGQALEIVKMGADRTGYGPQATNTNVNVNVDLANRLQAARERVKNRTINAE